MIDLYKQTEHHKSSLRQYAPVHLAAIVSVAIFLGNLLNPDGLRPVAAVFTQPPADPSSPHENSAADIPGKGFASPVQISEDIRLDRTPISEDKIFWQNGSDEEIISELLDHMSDEQIVSQVFLVGWESETAEGPVMDWIEKRGLGGVKVFGWNGNNVATLGRALSIMQARSMDNDAGIPLITATDQEGGWVRHIKDTTSITPGNMAIGASALPMDSYLSGYYIGQQLRAIGVNMNFAPTVDVYINNDAHVIGPRAFSADPLESGILGLAFYQGMQMAGVMATAKHFPGHGNAYGDSHGYLPVIEDDFETVWQRDLLPYRMMIREGLPAVLSGHLNFPNITGNERPASLSPYFKQTVLRDRLNFEGIVITDDLYMRGAIDYGDQEGWGMDRIVLEALRAGNDMVMLSETPALNDSIWTLVLDTYREDEEFRQRIRESVSRVLRVKLRFLKPSWRVPLTIDPENVYDDIETFSGEPFFQEQAARGVTLIRDRDIPLLPEPGERILLVGQDFDFLREGREAYPGAESFHFSYNPFYDADPDVIARVSAIIPRYDRIIFNLANPNSLEVLRSLEDHGSKIIVFSSLTPVYLQELPWVASALAVYGWGSESFEAGFAALSGNIPFVGQLPVLLEETPDS